MYFWFYMAHGQTWTCFLFSQTLIVTKKTLCAFQRQDSYLISIYDKNKTNRGYKNNWYCWMKFQHTKYTQCLINPNTPPLKKGPRTSAECLININFVYKIRSIQVVTKCSNTVLFFSFCKVDVTFPQFNDYPSWIPKNSLIRKKPTTSETTSWSATPDWSMISNEAN